MTPHAVVSRHLQSTVGCSADGRWHWGEAQPITRIIRLSAQLRIDAQPLALLRISFKLVLAEDQSAVIYVRPLTHGVYQRAILRSCLRAAQQRMAYLCVCICVQTA